MERGYSDYQQDIKAGDKKQIDFPIFGLVNPARSYNCFLNSIIQAFWMIDSFRDFFVWYWSLYYAQDDKFIQELKCFFNEIMKTPKNEFDNNMKIYYLKDLRDEIAKLEGYEGKFNIGEMWDATELYDVILTKVHENLSLAPAGTVSCCGTILQEIIGLSVHIKCECPWGKTFDLPQSQDQYLIYVSAFKICERVKVHRKDDESEILDKFLEYNQKLGPVVKQELQNSFMFPDEDHFKSCKKVDDAVYKMSTPKEPEVLCLDLKWSEYEPLDVLNCFNLIPNSIKLSEIYDLEGQEDCEYILKGMVIYWGAHYYAFFRVFIDGEEEWLRVDDRTITKKGAWKDIVTESVNAMVTPTIILFEKYKESVLVPSISDMERKFKLDRYYLKSLIGETSKSKRKANYKDCRIEFGQQESTPSGSQDEVRKGFGEEMDVGVEKREKGRKEEAKEERKLVDYDDRPEQDEVKEQESEGRAWSVDMCFMSKTMCFGFLWGF